jgi:hypothetical protein
MYRNSGSLKVRSLSWRVTPLQDGKRPVNRLSESYTFLRTTKHLFLILYRFQLIWNFLDAGDDNKASLLWCDFRQNWGTESHVVLKNFYPYLPCVLPNWGTIPYSRFAHIAVEHFGVSLK